MQASFSSFLDGLTLADAQVWDASSEQWMHIERLLCEAGQLVRNTHVRITEDRLSELLEQGNMQRIAAFVNEHDARAVVLRDPKGNPAAVQIVSPNAHGPDSIDIVHTMAQARAVLGY